MRVVGFVGYARSGKDTCADWLVRELGFCKVALADPLKRIGREVFDFTEDQLWGDHKDAVDPRWGRTPRYVLQQLGTEFGRAMHQDVWVRYMLRTAERVLACGDGYSQQRGLNAMGWVDDEPTGVVVPDVRYQNEVDAILAAGGRVVRVHRGGPVLVGEAAMHASEAAMLSLDLGPLGAEVHNVGTIGDLHGALATLKL